MMGGLQVPCIRRILPQWFGRSAIADMVDMTYPLEPGMCVDRQRAAVFVNLLVQSHVQTSNLRRGALVVYTGLGGVLGKFVCEASLDFSFSIAVHGVLGGGFLRVVVVEMLMMSRPFSRGLQDDALASCLLES